MATSTSSFAWRKAAVQQTNVSLSGDQKRYHPVQAENFLVEKNAHAKHRSLVRHTIIMPLSLAAPAESTLKTAKLANYYDAPPTEGNEHGRAFRDPTEQELLKKRKTSAPAPSSAEIFRPRYARVIRLPASRRFLSGGDGRLLLGRP